MAVSPLQAPLLTAGSDPPSINEPNYAPLNLAGEPDSKLARFFQNSFFNRNFRDLTRTASSVLAITVLSIAAVAGRIVFAPMNIQFGGDNLSLGYFYAITNVVAFSGLYVWAADGLVREFVLNFAASENIGVKTSPHAKTVATLVGSIVVGALAQIAYSMLAWYYNQSHPEIVGITSADLIFSARSVYSGWNNSLNQNSRVAVIKKLFRGKALFVNRLNTLADAYAHCLVARQSIDRVMEQLESSDLSNNDKFRRFLRDLIGTDYKNSQAIPDTLCMSRMKAAAKYGLGSLLTLVMLLWVFELEYKGTKLVLQQKASNLSEPEILAASLLLAILALAAQTYILGFILGVTCENAVDSIKYFARLDYHKTFVSEALTPYFSNMLKIACVFFAIMVFASTLEISKDYLSENCTANLRIPSDILYTLANFSTYTPLRILSDYFLQECIRQFANSSAKNTLRRYQLLIYAAQFTNAFSYKSMALFLEKMRRGNFPVESINPDFPKISDEELRTIIEA